MRIRVSDKIPLGLLGMLAIVVGIERTQFRGDYSFLSWHAASWRFAERRVAEQAPHCDVLCFGDSMLKLGIMPWELRWRSAQSAYNFSVYIGPSPASYFMLRRALDAGARPRSIIVDFGMIQSEGPASAVRKYPWADLLKPRELLDLAWATRDTDLLASIVSAQVFHSVKDRYEIREGIVEALDGKPNFRRSMLTALYRNWTRNRGAQGQSKSGFQDFALPPRGPRGPAGWQCDPVNEAYIGRFLALAARHRVQVYWLIPPLSPGMQAYEEYRGKDRPYIAFVRSVQQRHPEVVVVDARYSGYSASVFHDESHLNVEGASALSAGMSEIFNRRRDASSASERWVKLPAYRPVAPTSEDLIASRLAVGAVTPK